MFCPSCGTPVTLELSYCNRCGANLKKEDGQSPTDALLDGIFWTTVFGLGLIFGGVALMKAKGVRDLLIVAYMILSSLAFLGIYGMHVWLFFRLTRGAKQASTLAQGEKFETKELEAAEARALPEPTPSVTENTTRSFEPLYTRKEKR